MNITIGLMLATVGTFLGGVWANESWGRYWAWDPIESSSLATCCRVLSPVLWP